MRSLSPYAFHPPDLYLSALFIAADVGQALLEFREVRANATAVIELLKREGSGHAEDRDLVAQVLEVTRDPRAFPGCILERSATTRLSSPRYD